MFSDSATSSASNITTNINSIPMLNGTNFKTWHENLQIFLGVMDLDRALRVSSPAPITVESSSDEKRDIEAFLYMGPQLVIRSLQGFGMALQLLHLSCLLLLFLLHVLTPMEELIF